MGRRRGRDKRISMIGNLCPRHNSRRARQPHQLFFEETSVGSEPDKSSPSRRLRSRHKPMLGGLLKNQRKSGILIGFVVLFLVTLPIGSLLSIPAASSEVSPQASASALVNNPWSFLGQNQQNTWYSPQTLIDTSNVATLK